MSSKNKGPLFIVPFDSEGIMMIWDPLEEVYYSENTGEKFDPVIMDFILNEDDYFYLEQENEFDGEQERLAQELADEEYWERRQAEEDEDLLLEMEYEYEQQLEREEQEERERHDRELTAMIFLLGDE